MTSGNLRAAKPPAITNEQALDDLHDIADGFLAAQSRHCTAHGRLCRTRQRAKMLRRSRGIRADAIALPPDFAMCRRCLSGARGSENTFCLVRGEQAVVSQHLAIQR